MIEIDLHPYSISFRFVDVGGRGVRADYIVGYISWCLRQVGLPRSHVSLFTCGAEARDDCAIKESSFVELRVQVEGFGLYDWHAGCGHPERARERSARFRALARYAKAVRRPPEKALGPLYEEEEEMDFGDEIDLEMLEEIEKSL